jgi:hypothetical protein
MSIVYVSDSVKLIRRKKDYKLTDKFGEITADKRGPRADSSIRLVFRPFLLRYLCGVRPYMHPDVKYDQDVPLLEVGQIWIGADSDVYQILELLLEEERFPPSVLLKAYLAPLSVPTFKLSVPKLRLSFRILDDYLVQNTVS